MEQPIKVLFLASEAEPFIKVGGLGDVAGSLPPALRSLTTLHKTTGGRVTGKKLLVDIRLVIPFHDGILRTAYNIEPVALIDIPRQQGSISAEISQANLDGLPVYLVYGPPFQGGVPVYTGNNQIDGAKYTFFSLVALQIPRIIGWQPDIIHANDWHTAPAIYSLYLDPSKYLAGFKPKTIITIHNLPYLGHDAGEALADYGLPPALNSSLPWWAQNLPLPLGLLAADQIVAVSPNYAKEIITPEFGSGLDDFLRSRQSSISGILNGIDQQLWNPSTDQFLTKNFNIDQLSNRQQNKNHLQCELNLSSSNDIPLLAVVSRLDPQKGIDLLSEATRGLASQPWQLIILGTGTRSLEENIRQLVSEFPDRIRFVNRYDLSLSHRIYGGADCLLIPSRYEPCGLTQMIAMRYGCVPVGRSTGGLKDTIRDHPSDTHSTGFLFDEATPQALAQAIYRALRVYEDQLKWRKIQSNGMSQDFSWSKSAHAYYSLYRRLLTINPT